jgi:hypothetical protein
VIDVSYTSLRSNTFTIFQHCELIYKKNYKIFCQTDPKDVVLILSLINWVDMAEKMTFKNIYVSISFSQHPSVGICKNHNFSSSFNNNFELKS